MTVLEERLGHELAARAEGAKIAVSGGEDTTVDLGHIETGLVLPLSEKTAVDALRSDLDRIIATAHEHSYSRTHLLSSMIGQRIVSRSDTLRLRKGHTFAFVSGLGGGEIRPQTLNGAWWASVYTASQGAGHGALFGVFLAGMVVAAGSNLFARLKNKPSALVRTPGILLLVPGSVGFRSIFFVFDGHVLEGISTGSSLIVLLTTLVAGLMFGDLLVPPRRNL